MAPHACTCKGVPDGAKCDAQRCECAQLGQPCGAGCPCGPGCREPFSLAGLTAKLEARRASIRQHNIEAEDRRVEAGGAPRGYCSCTMPHPEWGSCGSSAQCSCVAANLPCVDEVCGCLPGNCKDRGRGGHPELITAKAARDAAENLARHTASVLMMITAEDARKARAAGADEPCQCGSTHEPPTGAHPDPPRCCETSATCACRARGRPCTDRCRCHRKELGADNQLSDWGWHCRNNGRHRDRNTDGTIPEGARRRPHVIRDRGGPAD